MTRLMCACLVFAACGVAVAQDPKEFSKLSKPGPEHEKLAALVGTWELTIEGVKEKGKAEYKSILGGRFIQEEANVSFGAFAMEWVGIYGFDRQKKKYTAVWVDNMDTSTESGEGDMDAAGKVLSLSGQHLDPRSGKQAKFVWKIVRDDEKTMRIEMYEVDAAGKEKLAAAIRGTKVK